MKAYPQTTKNLLARIRAADATEFKTIKRALKSDSRITIQKALEKTERRLAKEQSEKLRVASLYKFEEDLSNGIILGLDEVGRGALAGPLAVGAVVLSREVHIPGLDDSKKIASRKREEIARIIQMQAVAFSVQYIDNTAIDSLGMGAALRNAFSNAIRSIEEKGVKPDCILLDGNPLHIDSREINVVKGDAQCASIAAASIIAKVTRDALMKDFSSVYPRYAFDSNKGYASSTHIKAIKEYGLSPIHRKSFCTNFLQESLF